MISSDLLKNLKDKKIGITGSNGFIATNILRYLEKIKINKKKIILLNSKKVNLYNLKSIVSNTKDIDYLIHLSAATGGVVYTKNNSSEQMYRSMIKDLNIYEACKINKIKKLITLGNFHAFPKNIKKGLKEEMLHGNLPTNIHLGVGWSKRSLPIYNQVYQRDSETKYITLFSPNVYGPHDTLDKNLGHIIPSLIIKCLKKKNFKMYGGLNALREFIFVDDLVEIILRCLIKLNSSDFYIINSPDKIKINILLKKIIKYTNFEKKIIFEKIINDSSKRYSSSNKLKKFIKYNYNFNLDDGLKETINWYKHKLNVK